MFDPNIKVKVLADFKYKDEFFVVANTHLSFDVYDSSKIAELVSLYNPCYSHKEFIELPSVDSLPFHVKEQLDSTYTLDKPKDQEYIPTENKPFYETIDNQTFSPFGASPYEDTSYHPKSIADSYEPVITEPKFSMLEEVKPSIAEQQDTVVKEPVAVKESVVESEPTISAKEYSKETQAILSLTKEELQDKTASELKKALVELDKSYDYTNKVEAIKHIITFK